MVQTLLRDRAISANHRVQRLLSIFSLRRWIAALLYGLIAVAIWATMVVATSEFIGPGQIVAYLAALPIEYLPTYGVQTLTHVNLRPWLVLGTVIAAPIFLFMWLHWMLRFGGFLSRSILAGLRIRSLHRAIAWFFAGAMATIIAIGLYMAVFYVTRTRFESDIRATQDYASTPSLIFSRPFASFNPATRQWVLPDRDTKKAAVLGVTAPLILLITLVGFLASRRERMVYGNSRLGTLLDAADAGLRHRRGIVLGSMQGQVLMNDSDQHVLVVGSPGMGKSQGVVIPSILRFGGSMICLDFEGVLWKRTSGWLKANGYQTYVFNPGSNQTDSFNPLDYVDKDPTRRITDLQKLAAIIVPDSEFAGDSVFWKDSARNLTASLLSFLVECPDARPTLGELYRIMGSVGDEQQAVKRLLTNYEKHLSEETIIGLSKFVGRHEKLGEGIAAELATKLEPFANNYLEALFAATTIPIENIRSEKIAVFIQVTPASLANYRRYIVMFLEKFMDVLMGMGEMLDGQHDVMLMLDEFGNAGEIDTLLTMMPLMRKYGLRVVPIVQDTAQIERNYERTGSEIFRTSSTIQVFLNFASPKDAKYISELAGTTTAFIKSSSYSYHHGRRHRHPNDQPIAKQVLPVNYLQSMPDHRAILRVNGYPVFEVTKIEGYQDPRFAAHKLYEPVCPPRVIIVKSREFRRQMQQTPEGRKVFISDLAGLKARLHLTSRERHAASPKEPGTTVGDDWHDEHDSGANINMTLRPQSQEASTENDHATGRPTILNRPTDALGLPPHDPYTGEILETKQMARRHWHLESRTAVDAGKIAGATPGYTSQPVEFLGREPSASPAADQQVAATGVAVNVGRSPVLDDHQADWLKAVDQQSTVPTLVSVATVHNLNQAVRNAAQHIVAHLPSGDDRRTLLDQLLEPIAGESD